MGAAVLAVSSATAAQAASYTVNDTADLALGTGSPAASCTSGSSTCTLRAAVQSADAVVGASTITVPAGTYKLTIPSTGTDDPSNGDLDLQRDVTISGSGSGSTIIDANSIDRAFMVQSGAALAISGVTIENGSPSANSTDGDGDGGAIDDDGGGLSVTGVVFHDNSAADQGGAIRIAPSGGAAVEIAGSTFLNNTAGGSSGGGGAIYSTGETLNVDSDTFSDNSAYYVGGAIEADGVLDVQSSTFSDNTSLAGGAINLLTGAADTTVDSSTFSGNEALPGSIANNPSAGGAIQNLGGALTADDDLFTENSSGSEGGAIYLSPDETSGDGQRDEPESFQGDEFDDNTAGQDGGAIAWTLGALTIEGSSFVGNTTPESGGAIATDLSLASGSPAFLWTMSNTTLADNSAASGGGIWFDFSGIPLSWDNDTIAFNHAAGDGGGNLQGGGVANAADATSNGGTGVASTLIADNGGGDCGNGTPPASTTDQFSAADAGHNMDSDGTCFSNTVTSDHSDASPALGQPTGNGGPLAGATGAGTETLQTVAELSGSASIGAGSGCEATDERGVPRAGPCDVGSYQDAAAALALTGSAPATASQDGAFEATFTAADNGPAPSTGTTLSIPLPTGMTDYAASASQGACTQTSTLVSCSLGNIGSGGSTTVTLVLSDANPGTARVTATASNAQGGSSTSTETTTIAGPTTTQGGSSSTTVTTTVPGPVTTVTEPPTPTVSVARPSATTGKASKLTKRSANVTGTYTVGAQTTLVFFQYGTGKLFGSTTEPASKTENGSSSAMLNKLKANTTYHYRLVAINASGVDYGKTETLRTNKR